MKETIVRLEELLRSGSKYISRSLDLDMAQKSSTEKWSKKEILGHLIDSGINNLQRFTEIQFENKPYRIRNYEQNELVKANDYQNAEIGELMQFWISINERILKLIDLQTEETLNFKIELDHGNISDLRFLIKDYVNHLEHHLDQIIK